MTVARIAIDLDDTLLDFNSLARFRMAQLAEENGDERLKAAAYHPWDEWRTPSDLAGMDSWQEIIDYCHHPDQIMSRDPLPGASDALWDLKRQGHELIFVSNRSSETYEPTLNWLEANWLPADKLLCHTDDKLASVRDCSYLVDDRPKTLVGFVHDPEWRHQEAALWDEADNERDDFLVRKAFGLVMPYNRNLTDVPNIYLAPSWPLLGHYLREKIPSSA